MTRSAAPILILLATFSASTLSACDKKPAPSTEASKAETKTSKDGSETATAKTPSAESDKAAPEAGDPAKEEPEPVKRPAIVYAVGKALWRVDADGTNARSLGLEVDVAGDGTGSTNTGSNSAAVSRDGTRVAYVEAHNIYVATFTETGVESAQLTTLPPAKDDWIVAAEPSFTEWSPDSSKLIVFLTEPGYEGDEPLPLPAGVEYGAYSLSTTDLELTRAAHIEGALVWLPDSSGVLDDRRVTRGKNELVEYPFAPGPAKVRRTGEDTYGFGQLHAAGGHLAWNASGPEGDRSEILVAPFAGGDPVALSPRMAFAEIQWPVLSPKGDRVVLKLKGQPRLSEGTGEPSALEIPKDARWDDNEHLLAVTSAGLVRIDLEGTTTVLDAKATALVRQ